MSPKHTLLPRVDFSLRNLVIFLVGLVVLAVGYILLSISPWDNPLSRSLAPVVLLIGYLVIIPIGIFHRRRTSDRTERKGETTPNR